MNGREYIGPGTFGRLSEVLSSLEAKRIFLVTGRGSYAACGAQEQAENSLRAYEYCRFCDFSTNPKIQDILAGIDRCRDFVADTVVAVGGGTVIDVAKGIRFLGTHRRELGTFAITPRLPKGSCRTLVAVPTTAGSGSESTHFSVVYVDGHKYSLAAPSVLPDVAIVDPDLTFSLSPYQTAISGVDALCQAIESYWSIHSTAASKELAKEAIQLIRQSLVQAVHSPSAESRLRMAQAAHLAGKAINITKTTAPHAISYPLTSYYGIPHGQAVAISISSLLVYNYHVTPSDLIDQRGIDYVQQTILQLAEMFGAKNVESARQEVDALIRSVGLEVSLRSLKVMSLKDVERITEHAFSPDRIGNNPRSLSRSALQEILAELLG